MLSDMFLLRQSLYKLGFYQRVIFSVTEVRGHQLLI
jgi:hypothetical protein